MLCKKKSTLYKVLCLLPFLCAISTVSSAVVTLEDVTNGITALKTLDKKAIHDNMALIFNHYKNTKEFYIALNKNGTTPKAEAISPFVSDEILNAYLSKNKDKKDEKDMLKALDNYLKLCIAFVSSEKEDSYEKIFYDERFGVIKIIKRTENGTVRFYALPVD